MIADSKANLYIRFGTTMEWDIAAGHSILQTANANLIGLKKTKYVNFCMGRKILRMELLLHSSSAVDLDKIKEHALSIA